MCGFVVTCGARFSKTNIESSLKLINHRGPDENHVWQNEKADVSFGHARLSIIDLDRGRQPLTNHDETLVAVVNGEFYNYKNIRLDLENDGYKFKTQSDSEIVLGLYERYGSRCVKFLQGEFAFVLYDRKNRVIFAARDYFGIKPLFYYQDNNAIYFASEAKAFKALGVQLKWDEDNLFQTLSMFPTPYNTLFADVKQIPPAHFLIKSEFSTNTHVQSYWDFNYPKADEQKRDVNEQEAIAGFRHVFNEAVSLRLQADTPVACYLSGGLDSCSILGYAQKLSTKPIEAFTLTFDNADYDESKQAEEMAQFSGSLYHPIHITQLEIANSFEKAVWHAERPLVNGHAVAKYLLSKAVHNAGLKVVLTGEGSDEIFGGYAHFRQDMILANEMTSDHEKKIMLDKLRENNKVSSGFLLASERDEINALVQAQIGFVPNWMRSFGTHELRLIELVNDDTKHKFHLRNHIAYALNFLDIAGQVEGRDHLSRSLYLWSRMMLPYYLLTVLGDRMEMAHSVEGRVPFLDHKVVEYVVNLPSHLKIRDLTEKYTLREAAKPYITKTIYERQKHPFMAPPSLLTQLNNPMATLIEDTLRGADLKNLPFIDQKRVVNVLDNFNTFDDTLKGQYDFLLMALTSVCIMHKRFELSA